MLGDEGEVADLALALVDLGGTNTPQEWLQGASVHLTAGHYALDVWRPGGDLTPGDGGTAEVYQGKGEIGYLALVSEQSPRLVSVPVTGWQRLCGQSADWVELVTGP